MLLIKKDFIWIIREFFFFNRKNARILGGSDFVDRILSEADQKEKATLRLLSGKSDLPTLLAKISRNEGVEASAILSGARKRNIVRTRKLLCQIAVCKMGYSGAEVARLLGISTSAVNRLASSDELPEVSRYLK